MRRLSQPRRPAARQLLDALLPRTLHETDRPSSTAQWTALGRALELRRPPEQRIVSDEYAPLFLSERSRTVLRSLEFGAPLVHTAERLELAGLSAFALCRHRFIDDQMRTELADGAEQVLILGAGYDSRAYRFAAELDGRPVYEVDLAPLSRRKAAIVAAHPDRFDRNSITRVEIDFRVDSLADRLTDSGFVAGARTVIVWEGVSMYLPAAAVVGTLGTLEQLVGPESLVAMDFWYELGGWHLLDQVRRAGARAIALVGEPITFGVPPDRAPEFLAARGFTAFDLVRSDELAARYSTDGRPSEKSVYVVAARR